MRTLYLECNTGISGDMFLGALINLGLDFTELQQELSKLNLTNYSLDYQLINKKGIQGGKFNVAYTEDQPHRHLKDIINLINNSSLTDKVKHTALAIFQNLAAAEAKIHGTTPEKVHFHEVGAVDSIIDIVGAAIAIDKLSLEKIYATPVPLGNGVVQCQHGLIPIPAPATLELITRANIPVNPTDLQGELVTPTGAAILATVVHAFGTLPLSQIENVGYGAGTKDLPVPNLLRITLGKLSPFADVNQIDNPQKESTHFVSTLDQDEILVIEANIDDMNPELYSYVFEKILALGALDVFVTPIVMKKGRPANTLTVICYPEDLDQITEILLRETSSLGIRYRKEKRYKSLKFSKDVEVEGYSIRVKYTTNIHGEVLNISPEYEDCKRVATATGLALKITYQLAISNFNS